MIRRHFLAYDDYIDSDATAYTSDALCERLASSDSMAIFIVATEVVRVPGTLTVTLEHSGDGVHFTAKPPTATTASTYTLTVDATNVICIYDNGVFPTLGHARLNFTTSGVARYRLRAYVTMRDVDEIPTEEELFPPKPKDKTDPSGITLDQTKDVDQKRAHIQQKEDPHGRNPNDDAGL